jgi:uncharacterized protein (TIGR03435 family)
MGANKSLIPFLALAASTTGAFQVQSPPAPTRFEVASIHRAAPEPGVQACLCEPPGRIAYRIAPLKWIIERAFELQDSQIQGPAWLDRETFNIDAKFPEGALPKDVPQMLRALLQDRFQLAAQLENRETPSFVLHVAPNGPKMNLADDGWVSSWRQSRTGIHLRQRMEMKDLAAYLATQLGKPVLDRTGLQGIFAVQLNFAPDMLLAGSKLSADISPPLPDALRQQLGLKLDAGKNQVDVLIIDRVNQAPAEN